MAGELEPRAGAGRPSVFNQERAERLLSAVRGGNYLETSAKYAGISYSTLRRWLLKADEPGAPQEYVDFKEALEKARADAEVAALMRIQKAGQEGVWQASAWFLERSFPDRWGKRDTARVELVGDGGGPIKMVAGMQLDDENMAALAQRLQVRMQHDAQDAKDQKTLEILDAEIVEDDDE